jgi:hypothetical protein
MNRIDRVQKIELGARDWICESHSPQLRHPGAAVCRVKVLPVLEVHVIQ